MLGCYGDKQLLMTRLFVLELNLRNEAVSRLVCNSILTNSHIIIASKILYSLLYGLILKATLQCLHPWGCTPTDTLLCQLVNESDQDKNEHTDGSPPFKWGHQHPWGFHPLEIKESEELVCMGSWVSHSSRASPPFSFWLLCEKPPDRSLS